MPKPRTLTLPSGRKVGVRGEPRESHPAVELGRFTGDALGVLRWTDIDELGELELREFHTLRVLLRKLERIDEPPFTVRCDNCDARFDVRPCQAVEPGPFLDGELDDPELDAQFDFDQDQLIGAQLRLRLTPLNVEQAAPIMRALSLDEITPRLVRALGITRLNDACDPESIAARLGSLPDGDFDAVTASFEAAHYPPRLTAPHRCPRCGQSLWLGAPALRELSVLSERVAAWDAPFLSPDEFEALVQSEADRLFAAMRVRNVDLIVVEGPADCDDAGEPLLGSYRPEDPYDSIPHGAEVRLYYRTFRNEHLDNGPYDVRAEIHDTLHHELEHHLSALAGYDPTGDEEDAALADEYTRRVGHREALRRAARGLVTELLGFARAVWPLWLVLFALLASWLVAGR